ncbi:MCE family protein [Pedococcus bigeumensis]|uniref:MCE family protein n=1 Tax=Pedococcus bigeumensis TaxID=433644 RepID=A0A502CL37_9MICO|nr:MCE family protein [Pedococcus bigeumensis]TPG13334.1 MCE family protein [Pedococcus bigeumensis]
MAESSSGFMSRLGNRAYGVGFIVIVGLLIGLSVASFQKRFTPVVMVNLKTDRIGSQLQTASDVKIRGLIVGEVRSIETTGNGATLKLALKPEMVGLIPANVSARLLPKTLFGERYVDLVTPTTGDVGRHIAKGDTIGQDRTTVAIELERVFEDLLPLLRTVQPEKLAMTLNALASALEGRGTKLGQNLVLVDDYFKAINPKLPVIKADISGLADLASTYAVAAPDLVRAAKALITTSTTIVAKKDQLAGFLAGTAGFANTTADFLDANGQRIIQVGRVQRPTVEVLAKYSPQYPCIATAMTNWIPRIDEAWRDKTFHITLEVTQQRPGYQPGEEPRWGETRGPSCQGLPGKVGTQKNPWEGNAFNDGTNHSGSASAGSALPSMFAGTSGQGIAEADSGLAGTEQEQAVVAALLSRDGHPSAITTLLAGPMLRGTVVNQ